MKLLHLFCSLFERSESQARRKEGQEHCVILTLPGAGDGRFLSSYVM